MSKDYILRIVKSNGNGLNIRLEICLSIMLRRNAKQGEIGAVI